MKKLAKYVVSGVLILVLLLLLEYGRGPETVTVIAPSNFKSALALGGNVYRQIHEEFDGFAVLAFGRDSSDAHDASLNGILRESALSGSKIDAVISLHDVDRIEAPEGIEFRKVGKSTDAVVSALKEFTGQGKRVILYASAGDVPHFHFENLIHILEAKLEMPILSLAMTRYFFDSNQANLYRSICRRQSSDTSSFTHLSCLAFRKSEWMRKNFKVDRKKFSGILEKHGERDYILFTNEP